MLARASGRSRGEIEAIVAELAPQPDVPTSVRKLPAPARAAMPTGWAGTERTVAVPAEPATAVLAGSGTAAAALAEPTMTAAPTAPLVPARRPIVQATAPERYRVQFTIGEETHEKLRRLQALLRREIPSGDTAILFDQGLALLLEKVEKAKLGAKSNPRAERAIRSGTDTKIRDATTATKPS